MRLKENLAGKPGVRVAGAAAAGVAGGASGAGEGAATAGIGSG